MAGSYKHCVKTNGKFNENGFTDMIENLGDAYEACEQMYYMIHYLTNGDKKKIEEAINKSYDIMRTKL